VQDPSSEVRVNASDGKEQPCGGQKVSPRRLAEPQAASEFSLP